MSLFEPDALASAGADTKRPLAERLRPAKLEDFIGQEHILGPGKPLRAQLDRGELSSLIFWGPQSSLPSVGSTRRENMPCLTPDQWGEVSPNSFLSRCARRTETPLSPLPDRP